MAETLAIPQSDGALLAAQAKAGQAGVDAYEAAKQELAANSGRTIQGAMTSATARGAPSGALPEVMSGAQDISNQRMNSLTGAQAAYQDAMTSREARMSDYQGAIQGARGLIKDQVNQTIAPMTAQAGFALDELRRSGTNRVDEINANSALEKMRFEAEAAARQQAWEIEQMQRAAAARSSGGGGGGGGGDDRETITTEGQLMGALAGPTADWLEKAHGAAQSARTTAYEQVRTQEDQFVNPSKYEGTHGWQVLPPMGAAIGPKPTKPTFNGSADRYSEAMQRYNADLAKWNEAKAAFEQSSGDLGMAPSTFGRRPTDKPASVLAWEAARDARIPDVLAPQSQRFRQNIMGGEYAAILDPIANSDAWQNQGQLDYQFGLGEGPSQYSADIVRNAQIQAALGLQDQGYDFSGPLFQAAIRADENAPTARDILGNRYGEGDTEDQLGRVQDQIDRELAAETRARTDYNFAQTLNADRRAIESDNEDEAAAAFQNATGYLPSDLDFGNTREAAAFMTQYEGDIIDARDAVREVMVGTNPSEAKAKKKLIEEFLIDPYSDDPQEAAAARRIWKMLGLSL